MKREYNKEEKSVEGLYKATNQGPAVSRAIPLIGKATNYCTVCANTLDLNT